jgi:hypothetical protein
MQEFFQLYTRPCSARVDENSRSPRHPVEESYIDGPTLDLVAGQSTVENNQTEEAARLLHVRLAACSSKATNQNAPSHTGLISISIPPVFPERHTRAVTDSIAGSLAKSIEGFVDTYADASEWSKSMSQIADSRQR